MSEWGTEVARWHIALCLLTNGRRRCSAMRPSKGVQTLHLTFKRPNREIVREFEVGRLNNTTSSLFPSSSLVNVTCPGEAREHVQKRGPIAKSQFDGRENSARRTEIVTEGEPLTTRGYVKGRRLRLCNVRITVTS